MFELQILFSSSFDWTVRTCRLFKLEALCVCEFYTLRKVGQERRSLRGSKLERQTVKHRLFTLKLFQPERLIVVLRSDGYGVEENQNDHRPIECLRFANFATNFSTAPIYSFQLFTLVIELCVGQREEKEREKEGKREKKVSRCRRSKMPEKLWEKAVLSEIWLEKLFIKRKLRKLNRFCCA